MEFILYAVFANLLNLSLGFSMYRILSFEHRGLLCVFHSLFYFLTCSSLSRTSYARRLDIMDVNWFSCFVNNLGKGEERYQFVNIEFEVSYKSFLAYSPIKLRTYIFLGYGVFLSQDNFLGYQLFSMSIAMILWHFVLCPIFNIV